MNRRIFANLILYDIRKGFRENKIKWIVGVFIFVFFSFITVSDFSVNSPELGFLAYFTNILQGMPPYIKTDDSVFTIPVSWFLFYAFLFFMVGFYPSSDLYGAGKKTLILSGSRFKWLWSKYIWTLINVIMYYAAMILVLAAVTCAIGKWSTKPDDMLMEMGIDMQRFSTGNEVIVWLILPMICACTIAVVQLTISIFAGAIAGYIVSIVYLVVSVYWVSPFLMGNYLMIIRNNRLCAGGMDAAAGIISCIIVMVVSIVSGSVYFNRKNIL